MTGYRIRSVHPSGLVLNECAVEAGTFDDALASARRFAASLVAAGPEGKSWDGWCVDLLDASGRFLLGVPLADAGRRRGAARDGASSVMSAPSARLAGPDRL